MKQAPPLPRMASGGPTKPLRFVLPPAAIIPSPDLAERSKLGSFGGDAPRFIAIK